ncbi:hypothetical protein AB0M02_18440 [Actinoplanes sp. NPDC051861]|uniref:hypothetical protein n=1 Tax=Actinoplanes sp. NPDC051861 TaxID=3155170 RepID=UPI0034445EA8
MTDEWLPALARYAERFHAEIGAGHHVASPLGAWLLLALTASAAPPSEGLADALGVEPARAAEIATELLENPHPMIAAASAVWFGPGLDPRHLTDWRATLPSTTEFGPLPDLAGADRWAREHTFGMIDKFPIEPTRDILLMLASALATRFRWDVPFDVVPAEALGGPWAARLQRVLRVPEEGYHLAYVATSRHAGQVIVHSAPASDDSGAQVRVVSVAAAPDVPPERVIAAAHEIAMRGYEAVSLWDLPLGDGPLWTIREEMGVAYGTEAVSAVLPSWSATSEHDLSRPGLGFDAATGTLEGLIGPGLQSEAKQIATARFDRYGFEAAAVTAFMVTTSAPMERMLRVAELRFAHPYAVVAVANYAGPWDGVPVFSAWVTNPEESAE